MRSTRFAQACACLLMLFVATGCTTYYRVTDQPTRKTYYTKDIDRTDSGAVRFYDQKNHAHVTLQSSEIIEISRHAFEDGIAQ